MSMKLRITGRTPPMADPIISTAPVLQQAHWIERVAIFSTARGLLYPAEHTLPPPSTPAFGCVAGAACWYVRNPQTSRCYWIAASPNSMLCCICQALIAVTRERALPLAARGNDTVRCGLLFCW
jgi:hypothetical protein